MKLLIINDKDFPLSRSWSFGGLETVSLGIYDALRKHTNHDVWIADNSDTGLDPKKENLIKMKGESYASFYKKTRAESGKRLSNERHSGSFNPENIKHLEEIINDEDFDLVITNVKNPSEISRILGIGARSASIIHDGEHFSTNPYFGILSRMKEKHKKSRIIAPSRTVKNGVNKVHPETVDEFCRWTFCEPGVRPVMPDGKWIMYAGRLMVDKKIHLILDSYALDDRYKLLLVGETWHFGYNTLRQKMIDAGEDKKNKVIMKNQPQDIVHEYMSQSQAFVLASIDESFCMSAFEAQKIGIPVIYAKMNRPCALDEYVIDGRTGISVLLEGKTKAQIVKEFKEAADKVDELNRMHIYKHFKENYSQKKFAKKLAKKLERLF